MKKFLKLAKNRQNYGHESMAPFFWPTLYIKILCWVIFLARIGQRASVKGDGIAKVDERTKPGKWLGSLLSVFLSALTPVTGDRMDTSPCKPIQISSTVLFWPRGSWLTKAHWPSKSRQLSRHWTFPLKNFLDSITIKTFQESVQ